MKKTYARLTQSTLSFFVKTVESRIKKEKAGVAAMFLLRNKDTLTNYTKINHYPLPPPIGVKEGKGSGEGEPEGTQLLLVPLPQRVQAGRRI